MTTIMKVSSLIIILLFTVSNAFAQDCGWNLSIDGTQVSTTTTPTSCAADMCVQYDASLPSFYPGIDECENACFVVTVNSAKKADLYIRSSNGYDQVYPQVNQASAIICFGPDSGISMPVPFTEQQTIEGGLVDFDYKSGGNLCTVMIEP